MKKMPLSHDELAGIITNNIPEGIYIIRDKKIIFLSNRFGEILGCAPDTLLNNDMVLPDHQAAAIFQDNHNRLVAGGCARISWGQPARRGDGTTVWIEVEAKLVKLDGREVIFGTVHDVTPKKLFCQEMSASSQTLRRVLDVMDNMIYVVTEDYRFVYVNRNMRQCPMNFLSENMAPWQDVEDFQEYPCYRLLQNRQAPCAWCHNKEVFANEGQPVRWEFFFGEPHNRWIAVMELAVKMPFIDERTKLVVARDITPWKKAEERIRTLSHGLLNAQESERNRLSRELHDDLGQQLNTVKLGLNLLAEDISRQKDLQDKVRDLNKMLAASISSVRKLATGLRPSFIGKMGLVSSIRTLCTDLSSTYDLAIELEVNSMQNLPLNDFIAINLFRVVQEALHNVIKHAGTGTVKIKLLGFSAMVQLVIEDDGRGFDAKRFFEGKMAETHLGLLGMAERVDLLNGTLDIISQAGRGTKILVEISLMTSQKV